MKTKAFTLIELILAIVIISICVLPTAAVFNNALTKAFQMRALTTVNFLAEEIMDKTMRLGYSGVSDVNQTDFASPFDDYSYEVIVTNVRRADLDTEVGSETGYKNIKVWITHNAIGTYTVTSLLTDYES